MFVTAPRSASFHPSCDLQKPTVCDLVKAIAIKVFKELALALLLGSLVAFFVATPSGLAFLISASMIQCLISIFFHSLGVFASYKAKNNPTQTYYPRIASLCEWVTGFNFASFTGLNTQILIHESGHAFASMLLYKKPSPSIQIHPFSRGMTQFYKTGLSPFGQKLGSSRATCFVIAAGPAFTLFISSILLAIGIALLKKYPAFGKYLIAWSVIDFINHAVYAHSALGTDPWNLSHDFVHLSIFGLNPMLASVSMIAIPILITLGMSCFFRSEKKAAPN